MSTKEDLLPKVIRVCSWFVLFFGILTAIVGFFMVFTEDDKIISIGVILFFLSMFLTGWFGRRYGLKDYAVNTLAKINAVISLLFGILGAIVAPIASAIHLGFEESFIVIRNLLIFFVPMIIAATAILSAKTRFKNQKAEEIANEKTDNNR